MSRKKLIIGSVIIVSVLAVYFLYNKKEDVNAPITIKVAKGDFINEVITSGEALSSSSKKIQFPSPANLQKHNIREIKIQDLVPEGSVVKEGDYIGRLDQSEVNEKIIDAKLNLENAQSKYIQQKLDTTLSLKQERNGIKDLLFTIEESKINLKQSTYEPPASIRKLEIQIEKANRDLNTKKENYSIKKMQAEAKMVEVGTEVSKIKSKLDALIDLQKQFIIYSTDSGMITYIREWDGSKKQVGSSINPWDPSIASLPDLSKMQSKTFANEVDIRKLKKGLTVDVGFDAFPDITLKGEVIDVANVGETKRGSDIKVFQIIIKLLTEDKNVRPGMTTSNRILTDKESNVLMVPIEAIFSKDSISYTYVKSGFSVLKKQVLLGKSNNNLIIIKDGLNENEVVYLNKPKGYEDKSITLLKN
ncbi:RND transporter [Polaribacter pacificus]|uniref:RND transporter n=1 Tax=Polaribacter pacificus TaxID=1775173 RepID=A0A917I151_9FLAO|nr:efflux RND transporter periplasmic adaptor subunit [Polaribacter pacificus]GGH00494.1 RND transporter [Polaribacter pacificus]